MVDEKLQADAELVAEAVAQRCSPGRKSDGSPRAPQRHALIWQAARLGAIEYALMTKGEGPSLDAGVIEKMAELLRNARLYVEEAVDADGGIEVCEIHLRHDLEAIDAALSLYNGEAGK